MTWRLAAAIVASYLLGAVPTSFLVARWVRGIDLRTVGSGNLGATNLFRLLGWRFALPVAVFDALKGAIPVAVFGPWAGASVAASIGFGFAALVGHVYSVFVGFRGGKGVATGAGIVLGLAPWAFVASLVVWAVTLRLSGYVSLSSILGAVALAPAVWWLDPERRGVVGWFAALALAVIWMHRANIGRLLGGTEARFGRPKGAGQ